MMKTPRRAKSQTVMRQPELDPPVCAADRSSTPTGDLQTNSLLLGISPPVVHCPVLVNSPLLVLWTPVVLGMPSLF